MKALLLAVALLSSTAAQANDPCDDVFSRAALQAGAEKRLEILGGCLAAPAEPSVHQLVALEMARYSLHAGERDAALRYLDLLREMLDATALPDDSSSSDRNQAGDR